MTVMAPHESKMFEAMIQSLDQASGTAKVKFAKVSFRNKTRLSVLLVQFIVSQVYLVVRKKTKRA